MAYIPVHIVSILFSYILFKTKVKLDYLYVFPMAFTNSIRNGGNKSIGNK